MFEAKVCVVGGVLAALAGCMSAVPQMPSKGGPAWHELTSPHFTVWTDGDPREARELIREMETVRQVIVGAAFPSAPGNARYLVVALRDDGELAEFSTTREARSYALPAGAPLWQPLIVTSLFTNWRLADNHIAHELTYAISSGVVRYQPRWLAEGLAQYFETMQIDGDGAVADVGAAPSILGQRPRLPHLVSMSTLFRWNRMSGLEDEEYSTSWALVTYLLNTHGAELQQYFQLLEAEGKPRNEVTAEEAAQLWNRAFPTLPASEVRKELGSWLTSGAHRVYHFRLGQRTWPSAERALTDADVLATRALLRLYQGRRDDAGRDADAALAADATHVLGRLIKAAVGGAALSGRDALAMTDAHRADWRGWWMAAMLYRNHPGLERELATASSKACSLLAQNPALVVPPDLVAGATGPRARDACAQLVRDGAALAGNDNQSRTGDSE